MRGKIGGDDERKRGGKGEREEGKRGIRATVAEELRCNSGMMLKHEERKAIRPNSLQVLNKFPKKHNPTKNQCVSINNRATIRV